MTHCASSTRSPSNFSFTCSTPCVDGCWGPMLTVISLASNNVWSCVVDILSSVAAVYDRRFLILRRNVVPFRRPRFAHVVLLSRLDSEMLPHPLHILQSDVVIL